MSTLNEEILRLEQAKTKIDEILIARGVSIPTGATLDTYHNLINSIQGGTTSFGSVLSASGGLGSKSNSDYGGNGGGGGLMVLNSSGGDTNIGGSGGSGICIVRWGY